MPTGIPPATAPGGSRWRVLLVVVSAFVTLSAAQAREISIAEPSAGLAFSKGEIDRQAERERARFMQRSAQDGLLGCREHCAVTQRVWNALAPVLRTQQPVTHLPLRLVVVRNPEVEALSFADGTVVISEAFIDRMQLDAPQMAFVLAHEAAHVLLQHERQTLTSMLALMPSTVQRTPRDLYVEMEFKYFSMSDAWSVLFHQVEFEADEIGFQLASLAGFQPQAQLRFMQQLASAGTRQGLTSTHPTAGQRLRQLQDLVPLAQRLYLVGRE